MAQEDSRVVLTDEQGEEHEFEVLDIMELDQNEYAILLPVIEDGEEAVILKIGLDENEEEILYEIEDDDEWEMVAEAWQKIISGNNGESE